MIMKILIKATVLAVAATAAKIPARCTDNTPDGFRLWANMTYPDVPPDFGPYVQGQELGYVLHSTECLADVILVPAGHGSVFRTDGDTVGVARLGVDDNRPSAGVVVTPGGTATVPSGRPVELRCSGGTPGIFLTDYGLEYPEEAGPPGAGGFMACKTGSGVVLSFFRWGQRPLLGCTVVQLLPIYY
ncbi:hypothetical protein CH063_02507 [Colletotrichum higginsianum]|uniref:DUF7907 domain-containing protein n=2 Tax=Colletotrichum higginsianum TaxID=80884 RepID=H1VLG4_COLHI|nr:hypothetical protein CH63R_03661 [Colletotrichum higginsianum IMI 349063]OBR11365.1 hypothetical protein CH63R_03661 [Colletotrichum higginsianum IMI 349063]CCF41067.1 hypothetical protein CH063_02507 [Colletotrichum higginsianum]